MIFFSVKRADSLVTMNENREYDPWPLEINVCENGKDLELSFDNNEKFSISAELLRLEPLCRSTGSRA